MSGWQSGSLIALVIAGIILGGHYLMRPVFRFYRPIRLAEIFVAAALLLVILTALATRSVGLSPALWHFPRRRRSGEVNIAMSWKLEY